MNQSPAVEADATDGLGTAGAVQHQIQDLLGDADAPDRWLYRSLTLLTSGDAVTGMQVAHLPVCIDPQASSS